MRWYIWLFPQPVSHALMLRILLLWEPCQKPRGQEFVPVIQVCWGKLLASNGCAIFLPSSPSMSCIVVCYSRNCSLMGSCHRSKVSHESILLGSGNMTKWLGICDGKRKRKIVVSSLSSQCQIARESICNIIIPSKEPWTVALDVTVHEEASMMSSCGNMYFGLDFIISGFNEICLSHPSFGCWAVRHGERAVPFFNCPMVRLIQAVVIAAWYSSRLCVARKWSLLSFLKHQANP